MEEYNASEIISSEYEFAEALKIIHEMKKTLEEQRAKYDKELQEGFSEARRLLAEMQKSSREVFKKYRSIDEEWSA